MTNETEIEDTSVTLPEGEAETPVEVTETVEEESADEDVVEEVATETEPVATDIKTKNKGMPETDEEKNGKQKTPTLQ